MGRYRYDDLKEIAKKIKAGLAEGGVILEKTVRRRPRDREKRELLLRMAINRLRRYPPVKTGKGIILPYFSLAGNCKENERPD